MSAYDRVPDGLHGENIKSLLSDLNSKIIKKHRQLASGQRIQSASDDPQSASRALSYKKDEYRIEQFIKNGVVAEARANKTAAALEELFGVLEKAQEVGVSNANDLTKDFMSFREIEVDGLLKQAFSASNASLQGEYLFGGTQTDTPPFTATYDAQGNIQTVSFVGNTDSAEFYVADNIKLSPVADANTVTNMLTTLNAIISLRDALKAQDSDAVATVLKNDLVPAGDNTAEGIARIGGIISRIQIARAHNEFAIIDAKRKVSEEVSTDISNTIVDLTQDKTALEAASAISTQILQHNGLLQYLR